MLAMLSAVVFVYVNESFYLLQTFQGSIVFKKKTLTCENSSCTI